MSQRRIDALRELAARGATQGERDTAQRALDVHLGKRATPKPPPSSNTQQDTPDFSSVYADLLRQMRNQGFGFRAPYVRYEPRPSYNFQAEYNCKPSSEPAPSTERTNAERPYWAQAPSYVYGVDFGTETPKAPPKTRDAMWLLDFPDAERATGNVEDEFVRVEVTTAAEMHRRFDAFEPFKIAWCDRVWDVSEVSGYSHDRTQQRFYLHVRKDAMKIVKVPT